MSANSVWPALTSTAQPAATPEEELEDELLELDDELELDEELLELDEELLELAVSLAPPQETSSVNEQIKSNDVGRCHNWQILGNDIFNTHIILFFYPHSRSRIVRYYMAICGFL